MVFNEFGFRKVMYKFYKLCLLVFLFDIKFFKSYNFFFRLKKINLICIINKN